MPSMFMGRRIMKKAQGGVIIEHQGMIIFVAIIVMLIIVLLLILIFEPLGGVGNLFPTRG